MIVHGITKRVPVKRDRVKALLPVASTDISRTSITGVFRDAETQKLVAADGRILLAAPSQYRLTNSFTTDRNGELIKEAFPKWKRTVDYPHHVRVELDLEGLMCVARGVVEHNTNHLMRKFGSSKNFAKKEAMNSSSELHEHMTNMNIGPDPIVCAVHPGLVLRLTEAMVAAGANLKHMNVLIDLGDGTSTLTTFKGPKDMVTSMLVFEGDGYIAALMPMRVYSDMISEEMVDTIKFNTGARA